MPSADPRDPPPSDAGFGRLLPECAPAGAGVCPDEETLAGFVERRLIPLEREAVEGHLAGCAGCASAVASLSRAGVAVGPRARPFSVSIGGRSFDARPLAAAALLVAGIGLAIAAPRLLGRSPGARATAGGDAILLAAAADLASTRPDLFADFRPLDRAERIAPGLELRRGEFPALHPAGKVLDARPQFRWEPPAGARRFRVALFGEDGRELWSADAEGGSADYAGEPLRPGRYLWEVSTKGPLPAEAARRAFEIVGEAERRGYEEALRAIDERVAEPGRTLLKAHFAIRGGFLGEADGYARAYAEARASDPVGTETLRRVRALLGSREAD